LYKGGLADSELFERVLEKLESQLRVPYALDVSRSRLH
jgi:hypothetical protein